MTTHWLPTGLTLLALTVAGCTPGGSPQEPVATAAASSRVAPSAGSAGSAPTHHHSDHDHAKMTPAEKAAMGGSEDAGPSAAAAMVCGREVRGAVTRTLALAEPVAEPTPSWDGDGRLFGCVYRVRGGLLLLSVQDATDPAAGEAVFTATRSSLRGARRLTGVAAFGLVGYESPDGTVIFLKDGKTLRVDASGLRGSSLPAGFDRAEVAYGVAAAVVACWTE